MIIILHVDLGMTCHMLCTALQVVQFGSAHARVSSDVLFIC